MGCGMTRLCHHSGFLNSPSSKCSATPAQTPPASRQAWHRRVREHRRSLSGWPICRLHRRSLAASSARRRTVTRRRQSPQSSAALQNRPPERERRHHIAPSPRERTETRTRHNPTPSHAEPRWRPGIRLVLKMMPNKTVRLDARIEGSFTGLPI